MKLELDKADLVNLVSSQFISINDVNFLTDIGLIKFTGNQWNEDWAWKKEKLQRLSETQLYALYTGIKNKIPASEIRLPIS